MPALRPLMLLATIGIACCSQPARAASDAAVREALADCDSRIRAWQTFWEATSGHNWRSRKSSERAWPLVQQLYRDGENRLTGCPAQHAPRIDAAYGQVALSLLVGVPASDEGFSGLLEALVSDVLRELGAAKRLLELRLVEPRSRKGATPGVAPPEASAAASPGPTNSEIFSDVPPVPESCLVRALPTVRNCRPARRRAAWWWQQLNFELNNTLATLDAARTLARPASLDAGQAGKLLTRLDASAANAAAPLLSQDLLLLSFLDGLDKDVLGRTGDTARIRAKHAWQSVIQAVDALGDCRTARLEDLAGREAMESRNVQLASDPDCREHVPGATAECVPASSLPEEIPKSAIDDCDAEAAAMFIYKALSAASACEHSRLVQLRKARGFDEQADREAMQIAEAFRSVVSDFDNGQFADGTKTFLSLAPPDRRFARLDLTLGDAVAAYEESAKLPNDDEFRQLIDGYLEQIDAAAREGRCE